VTEFNELSRDMPRPTEKRWRQLDPPVPVRAYIAGQWHDLLAIDIDDETRELRVELPPQLNAGGVDLISHRVMPPSLYEAPPGSV
jgi:hypothetical protein